MVHSAAGAPDQPGGSKLRRRQLSKEAIQAAMVAPGSTGPEQPGAAALPGSGSGAEAALQAVSSVANIRGVRPAVSWSRVRVMLHLKHTSMASIVMSRYESGKILSKLSPAGCNGGVDSDMTQIWSPVSQELPKFEPKDIAFRSDEPGSSSGRPLLRRRLHGQRYGQKAGRARPEGQYAHSAEVQARMPGKEWRTKEFKDKWGTAGVSLDQRRKSPIVEISMLLVPLPHADVTSLYAWLMEDEHKLKQQRKRKHRRAHLQPPGKDSRSSHSASIAQEAWDLKPSKHDKARAQQSAGSLPRWELAGNGLTLFWLLRQAAHSQ